MIGQPGINCRSVLDNFGKKGAWIGLTVFGFWMICSAPFGERFRFPDFGLTTYPAADPRHQTTTAPTNHTISDLIAQHGGGGNHDDHLPLASALPAQRM